MRLVVALAAASTAVTVSGLVAGQAGAAPQPGIRQVSVSSLEPLPPSLPQTPPTTATDSAKQEPTGVLTSKNAQATGALDAHDTKKLRKKLREVSVLLEQVKHRHLDSAFSKYTEAMGPHN
ncbi:hypothetical protein ACFFHJ_20715 [Planotetraspora thailandica]|nr:hypothetical protein [Planotetraspora thailandica]